MSDDTSDDRPVLGIDFGTCNSCFVICNAGSTNISPQHLDNDHNATVPTAALYCDRADADPEKFPLIGAKAIEAYGECDDDEINEKKYRFQAMFKPDIVSSELARKCAEDFLRGVLRVAKRKNLPLLPLSSRVIIGVPSEADDKDDKFKSTLQSLARAAGFGEVETMPEPIGAMFSNIADEQINPTDALATYLVVDFGGGTCDFALLQNSKIVNSWGDMWLGGRLFDDLFYQWFVEQNPEIAKSAEKIGTDFFLQVVHCRELKEWFSDNVDTPEFSGKRFVGKSPGGWIRDLSRENFLQRARAYRPSATFIKIYQEKMAQTLPEKLTAGKPIDLILWFEKELENGLRAAGKTWQDVKKVSLAGGSSLWFFVKEYVARKLGEKLGEKPRAWRGIRAR